MTGVKQEGDPSHFFRGVGNTGKKIDFWEGYREKFGNDGVFTISNPLFSKDKSKAIIAVGYHCGGLCGSGGTYSYVKEKGKWKQSHAMNMWISSTQKRYEFVIYNKLSLY